MVGRTISGPLTAILRRWDWFRVRGGLTNAFTSESLVYELRGRVGRECRKAGYFNDNQLDEFFRSSVITINPWLCPATVLL
eukprot:8759813-Lingulodinium_polyedra.AAC.1